MTNKIALTASMRSNLLSLKNTQSLLDKTQDRLSTGYKVNSAMDNPSSYFTAQALNSRASDLSTLLDSIGQAISTLEVADQGITTLQTFVEQAKSVANSARDTANVPSKATTNEVTFDPNNAKTDKVSDYVNVTAGTAQKVMTGVNTVAISEEDTMADLSINDSQTLDVTIGDVTKTYTFKTTATADDHIQLDKSVREFLDKVVDDFGGSDKVKADVVDGQISITTLDGKDVKVESARTHETHTGIEIDLSTLTGFGSLADDTAIFKLGDNSTDVFLNSTQVSALTGMPVATAENKEAVATALKGYLEAAVSGLGDAGAGVSISQEGAKLIIKDDKLGNTTGVAAGAGAGYLTGSTSTATASYEIAEVGTSVSEKLGFNSTAAANTVYEMSSEGEATVQLEFSIRAGDATKMAGKANIRADQTLADMGLADRQSIDIIVGDDIHTYTIGEGEGQISKSSTVQEFMDNIVYDIGRTKIKAELVDGKMEITTLDNSTLEIRSTRQTENHDATRVASADIAGAGSFNNVTITSGTSTVTVDLNGVEKTADAVAAAINGDAKAAAAGITAEVGRDGNLVVYDKNVGDADAPGVTFDGTSLGTINTTGQSAAVKTVEREGTSFNELVGFEPNKSVKMTEDMTVEQFRQAVNDLDGISADFDMKGHLVISGEQGDDLVMVDAVGSNVLKNLYGNEVVSATNGSNERAAYANQFDNLLEQIDQLVQDTSYKGVNLLKGDSLMVNFNESRTSTLNIKGVTFDSVGLGFTVAENEWISNDSIDKALNQITKATSMLRAQAAEFGQNLSTVQIREDFTQNMINNLQSGADKLTLADMNEEAANMLALQTRQQLGVNSLSLASQASQSVLKLF